MAGMNGVSASPNSSEEVDSRHGTPATKFSVDSPVNCHGVPSASNHSNGRSKIPPPFTLAQIHSSFNPVGTLDQCVDSNLLATDPFISIPEWTFTPLCSNDSSKLSPTASAFTPATLPESASSKGSSAGFRSPLAAPEGYGTNSSFSLAAASSPAKDVPREKHLSPIPSTTNILFTGALPRSCPFTLAGDEAQIDFGPFSAANGSSRYLKIKQICDTCLVEEIDDFLAQNAFSTLDCVLRNSYTTNATIYVKFLDIREAVRAYLGIKNAFPKWDIQYIGLKQFVVRDSPDNLRSSSVTMYDGQILVTARFGGPHHSFDVMDLGKRVKGVLDHFGEVMAFELSSVKAPLVSYRAEYYDIRLVDTVLTELHGFKVGMYTLNISACGPDLDGQFQCRSKASGPLIVGQDTGFEDALAVMNLSSQRKICGFGSPLPPSFSPFALTSPVDSCLSRQLAASSMSSFAPDFAGKDLDQSPLWVSSEISYSRFPLHSPSRSTWAPGTIGQERGVTASNCHRQGFYAQQQRGQRKLAGRQYEMRSNIVDLRRLHGGDDIRTTIMLRNIPNKIDQSMLKSIVDETSYGKYDFMYLRIDFANNCNVGYAFINFADPGHIIDFVNARAGRRWNRYNSDKVAEVSYATIQGLECLISKFRNSSVMLEHPSFRPKLFYTSGPKLGAEQIFPGPDNPSKMRRSVENAEHVGLFAPRAGQTFRDEQRRRRSQYDRGTRLAEIEDSFGLEYPGPRSRSHEFLLGRPCGRIFEPEHSRIAGVQI